MLGFYHARKTVLRLWLFEEGRVTQRDWGVEIIYDILRAFFYKRAFL